MGSVRGVYRYVKSLGLRIGVLGPQGLRSSIMESQVERDMQNSKKTGRTCAIV